MTTVLAPARSARNASPPVRKSAELEGVRGLAALGIVVFHAYQFNRGDVGAHYALEGTPLFPLLRNLDGLVSLFLVLSGYLLYRPLVRALLIGDRLPPVRVYLLRRATRILPLYWSAVLVVWAARNPGLPGDWRDLVEHMTFTQVFDSKRIFYTIGPAWSLSVEIFFYLFLAALYPLFGRLVARGVSRWQQWAAVVGAPALLAASGLGWTVWAVYVAHEPATRWSIWFNPLAKGYVFAAGMAVAVAESRFVAPRFGRRFGWLLYLGAAALIVPAAIRRTDQPAATAWFGVLTTVAFALVIAALVLRPHASRASAWLGKGFFAWAGVISYSLYLWHEPVLLLLNGHAHLEHAPAFFPLTAFVLVVASIPIAWLSYHAVERPFGRFRVVLGSDGRLLDRYAEA